MAERWDDDGDFELSDDAFAIGGDGLEESGTAGNLSLKQSKPTAMHAQLFTPNADLHNEVDPFERSAISDAPSPPHSKEEEDQSSANSTKTVTSAAEAFSALSVRNRIPAPVSRSVSNSTTSSFSSSGAIAILPSTPKAHAPSPESTPSAPDTLRSTSQLSGLVALANSGPGRVHHLGSTPQGQAKSVLGDWDEDLDFGDVPSEALSHRLKSKASFASHISDDPDDERLGTGLPTPRSDSKSAIATSIGQHKSMNIAEYTDEEDGFDLESDFELPDDKDRIALSPLLARASSSSLHSASRAASTASQSLAAAAAERSGARHSSASPALTHGNDTTTTEDDLTDDEAFFDDIVLPPYFTGGPGALTPPSDGEKVVKLDLQARLKRNLEARGGRGLDSGTDFKQSDGRLIGYREGPDEDEGGERDLVIDSDVKLGQERIRTHSRPTQPALLKSRRTASGLGTGTKSQQPPLPLSRAHSDSRRAQNLSTGVEVTLSRSDSAASLPSLAARPQAAAARPASAQGAIERVTRDQRRGARPPPAPSIAARDRIRSATLLSTPSMEQRSNLRALSPVPMTPQSPVQSMDLRSGLRRKQSAGNLLATPSRTLERKRSLQHIGQDAMRTPANLSRKQPAPVQSSYAAPTTASMSRVRQRVLSSPTIVPPSPSPNLPNHAFASHPPRPSSAASGRLMQPTLASASKARAPGLTRAASNPVSGLRLPTAPLKLARPKSTKRYGDGSELDAFDDLPTDKVRERERTVSTATVKGPVGNVPRLMGQRRKENRSGSSTSSGTAGGNTLKARSREHSGQTGGSTIKGNKRSTMGNVKPEEVLQRSNSLPSDIKRRKREPQLIRNLGPIGVPKGALCRAFMLG